MGDIMDSFNTLLVKTASKEKSVVVLRESYEFSKFVKQAKLEGIKQMFRDKALNKTAEEEKPFMDRMSAWWDNNANKAGVAGAGIAGLLGYGLMPGKNKIMKLLAALGLGTAGYFGGQALWPTVQGWFNTDKTAPATTTDKTDSSAATPPAKTDTAAPAKTDTAAPAADATQAAPKAEDPAKK